MRKPIIAGNWKMNNTMAEAKEMVDGLKKMDLSKEVEAVLCVPYTDLKLVIESLGSLDIGVGAQNMHWEESGAYTGEISPIMLKELGVDYVIIGHSERRQYFNETNQTINKKIKSAFKHGIIPIMCLGESLEEKEAGREKEVVKNQLVEGLKGVSDNKIEELVIAYEPIWAIGTGKTASADDANEMIGYIREVLANIYSSDLANKIRIQYGGSVKPSNISELMSKPEVDGALVGGASLKAEDFSELVNY